MFSGVSKAPKIIITLYFLQGKSQVALQQIKDTGGDWPTTKETLVNN